MKKILLKKKKEGAILSFIIICFVSLYMLTLPLVSEYEAVKIAREAVKAHSKLEHSHTTSAILSEIQNGTPQKIRNEVEGLDYWIVGIEFKSDEFSYAEIYIDARTREVIDGRIHRSSSDGIGDSIRIN